MPLDAAGGPVVSEPLGRLDHPSRRRRRAAPARSRPATDLLREAHRRGHTQIRPAHDPVFATLPSEGARASDMANRAGITKQSMGEAIRDMVDLGLVQMTPDPADRRAKLVTFTKAGMTIAQVGKRHMYELEQEWKADEENYETAREVLEGIVEMMLSDA
jgi:DNA-binding MarR family transcriptional regulator